MMYQFRPMFPAHDPYGFLKGCYDGIVVSRGWGDCNLCENCYRRGQCTTVQNETARERFREDQEKRELEQFLEKQSKQARAA